MKKLKYGLCLLFVMVMSLTFSPLEVVAGSNEVENKQYTPEEAKPKSDNPIIQPKLNCDPKMVIPGDPSIDPQFIINYLP